MSHNKKQVSCLHLLKTTIFSYYQTFKTSKQLTIITPKFFLQNKITTRQTILVAQIKLIYSVVCCCQLNDTQIFDEHLFGQVNSHTGRYKLPILFWVGWIYSIVSTNWQVWTTFWTGLSFVVTKFPQIKS